MTEITFGKRGYRVDFLLLLVGHVGSDFPNMIDCRIRKLERVGTKNLVLWNCWRRLRLMRVVTVLRLHGFLFIGLVNSKGFRYRNARR